MVVKMLQVICCAAALISIQGCFVWHSSTVRDNPPSQTTTVYHEPAGDAVAVTTTR